jgi:peptidoglycan-N-acetylglucosamine deacetylase
MLLRCLLAWLVVFFAGEAAAQPDAPSGEAVCWKPGELASHPGDKDIRKNIPSAYAAPPSGRSAPLPALRPGQRGAIRRVELPHGSRKLIALTFDMCEQPYEVAGYDGAIVDFLRAEQVRATFFAGGKWLLTHQTPAQQLMSDPLFEVGNHTWEHRNLRLLAGAGLDREIEAPQRAYEKVREPLEARQCLSRDGAARASERAPKSMSLFRFPFGACNPEALDAVNGAGLLAIQWDVSSGDPSLGALPGQMANGVLHGVKPGSIVLFHGNGRGWHTAEALREIVPKLRAQSYEFVMVTELLNAPGAKWDIRPVCFDSRPGDTDRYDDLARRLEARFQKFTARFGPQRSGEAR